MRKNIYTTTRKSDQIQVCNMSDYRTYSANSKKVATRRIMEKATNVLNCIFPNDAKRNALQQYIYVSI